MPGWLDNAFHSHGKRELVPLAVDGLFSRAISRCGDLLTDGFVEASWAEKQLVDGLLGPKQRRRVLDLAVEHRVLEFLPAGETVTTRGAARQGLRGEEVVIELGPFPVDGYVVHDYLDCNRSRAEVEETRAREAAKKRRQRKGKRQEQLPWQQFDGPSSSSLSPGESPLKTGDSGDRVGSTPRFKETDLDDARAAARSSDPQVQDVLDVLSAAPRLFLDAVAVENAIAAFPAGDPLRAAREAVTLGRDPAYRSTNGARLLWKALEQQTAPRPGSRRGGGQHTAADFQSLKGVA